MPLLPLLLFGAVAAWRYVEERKPQFYDLLFNWPPIDLLVYLRGAEEVQAGRPLYEGNLVRDLPFTYPPFSVWLFEQLRRVDLSTAAIIWQATMGFCLVAVLLMVFKDRGRGVGLFSLLGACAIAGASFATTPVRSSFFFGQINMLLMFLVFVDLMLLRRVGGVGVGIAAGLKLTPAFTGIVYLVERRWIAALVSIATFCATVGIGFAVVPDADDFWTRAMFDSSRVGNHHTVGAQSLHSVLVRVTGADITGLWLAVSLFTTAVTAWIVWAALRHNNRSIAICTAGIGACLVSPFTWHHHWVWVIPLAVALALTISNALRSWLERAAWTQKITGHLAGRSLIRNATDVAGYAVGVLMLVPYVHAEVWPEMSVFGAPEAFGYVGQWLFVLTAPLFLVVYALAATLTKPTAEPMQHAEEAASTSDAQDAVAQPIM